MVATAVHAAIVTLAGFLSPLLASERIMSITGKLFVIVLAGLAFWVGWSTR
ncbi:hypothetical protein [Devosia psychrophila]|uniref:hypothetical protein n=1 Tax=Devosia psychrophila TaxID=728005 RepID=UPI00130D6450|nr:hypothetical protein [Devosia psychrophila]